LKQSIEIPEQGQIVKVRQRTYTVTGVSSSAIPDMAAASQLSNRFVHLVNLTSVEDDALGEALQVIWELEVGSQIIERAELPEPNAFDAPDRLDAFLDAVRWGASSQADRAALQAPFRSGIHLQNYQLNPLVRAVQMPRVSLLIADDVGLGKTVETGLVIQELITRNRARTVLVICPAGLQLHWHDQMRDKFGLEFRIIDSDSMRQLRRTRGIHVNPWSHFPRLITSMDFIKRERPLRLFMESVQSKPRYPRPFDILVLDEAHNVAPSGRGQYAMDSQRTQAIRDIVPSFEHHMFLSATPHNGFPESFSALLELLDNQRFARGITPDPRQLELVMVRRLKRDIKNKLNQPTFPSREIHHLEVGYTDDEREVHRWLREYHTLRLHHAQSDGESYAAEFVLKLLKKRLLSSPKAFQKTLERHMDTLKNGTSKQTDSSRPTTGILRRQIAQAEEDYADDDEYEAASESALTVAARTFSPPSAAELDLLERMHSWAKTASDQRDSKTRKLIEWLRSVLKPNGIWTDERVILFTEYRTTQKWLQEVLVTADLADASRLEMIYGGMKDEERERIKSAFQAAPSADNKVRILLATDAASEGIDLQNYCHRLVHIEIPWNPNRMEQRNGRIDRMGQRFSPEIYHFAPQGYSDVAADMLAGVAVGELEGDLEFLMRAVRKVDQMREDLMGKVGDVIAKQVEEAMLGVRHTLDVDKVEASIRPARALLKLERQLDDQIDKQIRVFYEQRQAMHLVPANVQKVVEVALEIAGQPPLQPAAAQPGAFFVPPLRGTWSSAKDGLKHPFTQEERPIVFDERLVNGDSVVLAHLNHPLVTLAQRLLRAEVWSPQGKLNRVTARIVPNSALNSVAVIAHARVVVIGGERYRLHEELITAGGYLTFGDNNRTTFRRMNVGDLTRIVEAATDVMPNAGVLDALKAAWPSLIRPLRESLDVRMVDKLDTVYKQLEERRISEAEDVGKVLLELENAIRKELDELAPNHRQLELPLFSEEEKGQYDRDVNALRTRLARIPLEIKHEQETVHARYQDLKARLFPVAVTFLIPEQLG
jgi:superfamily II DNA or RNA helicase